MHLGGQRKRSTIAVIVLGSVLMAVALALNVTWIIGNWKSTILLVLGVLCFAVLMAGLALNTVYLVREIRRNEQQDAFINAVTHELKTPVASIRLYLQTLQQRDVAPEKRAEFVDVMLADVDRLQGTIDQVLLAGKTGISRRPAERADVDLGQVARECLDLAAQRHHLQPDAYVFETDSDGPAVVTGDEEELKAAVANLLDNAVKYSGETVGIVVRLTRRGAERIALQVQDQGIGITSHELKRVFKRFYRISGGLATRVKGTGLGLHIVRAVAKRHGGRAYVESEGAGKGSTFTLELPLKSA